MVNLINSSSSKIFISRRDVKNKLTKTFRVNTLGNVGYIG